jgi:hypothetical protein
MFKNHTQNFKDITVGPNTVCNLVCMYGSLQHTNSEEYVLKEIQ